MNAKHSLSWTLLALKKVAYWDANANANTHMSTNVYAHVNKHVNTHASANTNAAAITSAAACYPNLATFGSHTFYNQSA